MKKNGLKKLGMVALAGAAAAGLVHCVGEDAGNVTVAPGTEAGSDDAPASTVDGNVGPGADANTNDDATTQGDGAPSTTVNGVVHDYVGGPYANAKVRIGKGAVVTTGPDGKFSIANAPATYDLDVGGIDQRIAAFRGLTTRTPVVQLFVPGQNASVTYSVQSFAFDGGLEHGEMGFVSMLGGIEGALGTVATTSGSFNVNWSGGPSANGSLVFLVSGYDGAGNTYFRGKPSIVSTALTSNGGATATFAYVDAPSGSITGNSSNIPGTIALKVVTLHDPALPAPGVDIYLDSTTGGTTFSLPTVNYQGGSYDVHLRATQADPNQTIEVVLAGVSPTSSSLLPGFTHKPAQPVAPANNEADITPATQFSWTSDPGVACIETSCSSSGYFLIQCSSATSFTLDDFTGVGGAPLPHGGNCFWNVQSYPSPTSVDDFAGGDASRAKLNATSHSSFTLNYKTQ